MHDSKAEKGSNLGLPRRYAPNTFPYWHTDQNPPMLHGIRLDPGYKTLKTIVGPEAVISLQQCGAALNSLAALRYNRSQTTGLSRAERSLLDEAADALISASATASNDCGEMLKNAGVRLTEYSKDGEWRPVLLPEPVNDVPYIYCGPLSTWKMRDVPAPITLAVFQPDSDAQDLIDSVDKHDRSSFLGVAEFLTGKKFQFSPQTSEGLPSMRGCRLIYTAGESFFGHKNFAHFFPLETPNAFTDDVDFTIVLSNVLESRLENVTIPLGNVDLPRFGTQLADANAIYKNILKWFRCHDMAHFVNPMMEFEPASDRPKDDGNDDLTSFAHYVLDEAIADSLGLVTSIELFGQQVVDAFVSELWRYAFRRFSHFADSAAATLLIGYLIDGNIDLSRDPKRSLAPYVSVLFDAMYGRDKNAYEEIERLLSLGGDVVASLRSKVDRIASDHHYQLG